MGACQNASNDFGYICFFPLALFSLSLSCCLRRCYNSGPAAICHVNFSVFCFCYSCCNCCCFCCFVCILLSACVTFLFVALCRQGQEKLHLFEITENCVARFEATPFAVYLPCPLSPPTLLPSLFLAFFFCCFLTCLLWRHNLTVLHNNLHSRTKAKTSAWICVSRSDREQRGGVAKFKNILHMRVLTRNIFNKLDSPSSLSL